MFWRRKKKKKFGPYHVYGPNEDITWGGHSYSGRHWETKIGELKINQKFSDDWTVLKGKFKPVDSPWGGTTFYKRVKVTKDSTEWEGFADYLGTKVQMKMTITRNALRATYFGEEPAEDKIEPPISDEDWAEFTRYK